MKIPLLLALVPLFLSGCASWTSVIVSNAFKNTYLDVSVNGVSVASGLAMDYMAVPVQPANGRKDLEFHAVSYRRSKNGREVVDEVKTTVRSASGLRFALDKDGFILVTSD